ncbi:MAG: DUF2815 family protein [Micavibrio sp.]|nr:DUF2815 family protein [Micavibrio sp.]
MSQKKVELTVSKINDKGAQVMLHNARLTFVYLDKPQKDIDGDPEKGKYTVTCIIPKADFAGVNASFQKILTDILKINKTLPTKEQREKCFKTALATGNDYSFFKIGDNQKDKTGTVYKGLEKSFTCVATIDAVHGANGFRPKFDLVFRDAQNQTLAEHEIKSEFYAGVFANVAINLYPYDFRGKCSVKGYLNGVLKTADGDRLSGVDPFAAYVPPAADETDSAAVDVSFDDADETPAKKAKPAAKAKGKK